MGFIHCIQDVLTPANFPKVGSLAAYFVSVGNCVPAFPDQTCILKERRE